MPAPLKVGDYVVLPADSFTQGGDGFVIGYDVRENLYGVQWVNHPFPDDPEQAVWWVYSYEVQLLFRKEP